MGAREVVVGAGFGRELDWQDSRDFSVVTESEFLAEAAWVVLSAGLSERVVHRVFGSISQSFCQWNSASAIVSRRRSCVAQAMKVFAHKPKIRAIAEIAAQVNQHGFARIKREVEALGVERLSELPFIGPVTSFHLAKNLGLDVVKPDRHLVRLAKAAQVADPYALCSMIAAWTGDRMATVDLILWRFATLERNYERVFRVTTRHDRTLNSR